MFRTKYFQKTHLKFSLYYLAFSFKENNYEAIKIILILIIKAIQIT